MFETVLNTPLHPYVFHKWHSSGTGMYHEDIEQVEHIEKRSSSAMPS